MGMTALVETGRLGHRGTWPLDQDSGVCRQDGGKMSCVSDQGFPIRSWALVLRPQWPLTGLKPKEWGALTVQKS